MLQHLENPLLKYDMNITFFNLIIISIQKLDDVISFYEYRRLENWLHISEPGSQFDDTYKLIFKHPQGYVLCSRVSIRTCFYV